MRTARLTRRPTSWARSVLNLLTSFLLGGEQCLTLTTALVSLGDAESSLGCKDVLLSGIANWLEFLSLLGTDDGQDVAGHLLASGCGLELLGSGIVDLTALGLGLTLGEQDELGLVRGKTLGVQVQLLLGGVSSPVVDGDANSASEVGGQTCACEFVEGESTSVPHLAGVLAGGRRNDWAQLLDGAGEGACCLCDSTLVSSKLLGWLVEVALCSAVPVLAQVDVCYCVVVLDHC